MLVEFFKYTQTDTRAFIDTIHLHSNHTTQLYLEHILYPKSRRKNYGISDGVSYTNERDKYLVRFFLILIIVAECFWRVANMS